MDKSKVVLGIICAAIVAGLIYNQEESASEIEQGVTSQALEQSNKSTLTNTLESSINKESISEPTLLTGQESVDRQHNSSTSSIVSSKTSQNIVSVLAKTDDKPADHFSDNQPKHHGHEHEQQRRNPEDNSIIPPGEPKKPLPEPQSKH
ncbi:hypothetical protein [Colwellia sp. 12G3]|uniref:hypothetical protein n=1 Tax=Colwellia sp. 12G3 TaxID=2058299 RepID=UPI000C322053|nr:hypothetical protein [Colwellia sp. 12G3]PKI13042.1 hypothetical protein CXF71_20275 [Colwellia sp. 12G3]